MKKRIYAKPTLISEEFVPQQYIATCQPPKWTIKNDSPILENWKGYLDHNNNGILDADERSTVIQANNPKGNQITDGPFYAFTKDSGERVVVWRLSNNHYVGYEEQYVDKNSSC